MKIQRDNNPILFFSRKERKSILDSIRRAEMQTSGEVRVHLERQLRGETEEEKFQHAKEIFEKLGMTKTEARNGVLILLGITDLRERRFLVVMVSWREADYSKCLFWVVQANRGKEPQETRILGIMQPCPFCTGSEYLVKKEPRETQHG